MKKTGLLGTLALTLVMAGCVPPRQPLPPEARLDEVPSQWRQPNHGNAPVAQWWRGFGDPALLDLVDRALARNTDVLIGAERLAAAREQIRLSRAALLPSLDAVFGLERSQDLGPLGLTRTTAAQPGLQFAYEVDLWGRLASLREAAELQFQASEAEQQTLRLALAATVAQGYVALLSLDRQLLLTHETVRSRRAALAVAEDRSRMGYTSELEQTQARSEYEAAAQLVPQLEQAILEQEHALRRLTDDPPGPVPRGTLAALQAPAVPGSLPSALLRQRPDLYQAELQLAASDRFLDSERDRFLPRVQLSASLGRLYVDALDYDPVKVWSLGASVLAPLFDGALAGDLRGPLSRRLFLLSGGAGCAAQSVRYPTGRGAAAGGAAEQIDRTLPRPGWRLAGAGACCYRAHGVNAGIKKRQQVLAFRADG